MEGRFIGEFSALFFPLDKSIEMPLSASWWAVLYLLLFILNAACYLRPNAWQEIRDLGLLKFIFGLLLLNHLFGILFLVAWLYRGRDEYPDKS